MDTVFSAGNSLALTGWGALALGLAWHRARTASLAWAGLVVPVLLAGAYVALLGYGSAALAPDSFSSIAGVRALFQDDAVLVAGWFHYLAFDLFVGSWIVRDGLERRMPRALVLLALPPTFLFGPAGLLLYLAGRSLSRRERLA